MPITELYSDYFQKSKTFLLPALGLKRSAQTSAIMTFIHWPGHYRPEDRRLIVVKAGNNEDPEYRMFEKIYLLNNVHFENLLQPEENTIAYIFNLERYAADWDHFLKGRYSLLSTGLKDKVKAYYGERSSEWEYIKSFLFPSYYFDTYARLLFDERSYHSGLEMLQSVGELCAPYDQELETLKNIHESVGAVSS
jgi:hypothetical protein